ncbi:hypothetical protein FRC12_019872 [Ceratobasidium sp. 428]|nr:hypothetical protein FRC12_019872 [Ceratobasidium sp. 428]
MPRPTARRPTPIALPNCPMDTLWEVDESSPDAEMMIPQPTPSSSTWFTSPKSHGPLRSIFEDDDDEDEDEDEDLRFPLPPASVPSSVRRLFTTPRSMSLPIQPAPFSRTSSPTKPRSTFSPSPRSSSLTPRRAPFPRGRIPSPPSGLAPITPPPRRQRSETERPVSPTSSASSSDTEPPRTPPAASTSLPIAERKSAYIFAPPPPAEWESAIDALFASS